MIFPLYLKHLLRLEGLVMNGPECHKTKLYLMNKLPKTKFNYFSPLKGV